MLRKRGHVKAEKRTAKVAREGWWELHPPQRQGRRAGRDQLRDRFRRPQSRVPDAREAGGGAHRRGQPMGLDKDMVPPNGSSVNVASSWDRWRERQAEPRDREDRLRQGGVVLQATSPSCTRHGCVIPSRRSPIWSELSAKVGERSPCDGSLRTRSARNNDVTAGAILTSRRIRRADPSGRRGHVPSRAPQAIG